jgi:hypothetical protein
MAPLKRTVGDALMKNHRAGLGMCLPGITGISPNQLSSILLFTFVTIPAQSIGRLALLINRLL